MPIRSPRQDGASGHRDTLPPYEDTVKNTIETLPIPTFTLHNGISIPAIGFGTFAKEVNEPGYKGRTREAVTRALEAGYRQLDCAWYYENEQEVGQALRDFLSKNTTISRAEIFITTKVWPHLCGSPEDVAWSLENSMQNLGIDYVDCFLVHWPFSVEMSEDRTVKFDVDGKHIRKCNFATHPELIWPTMEHLQRTKKTRTIGVSNWSILGLQALLAKCTIPPSMNQVEIHPLFPNTTLVSFCRTNHILPVAYSPLGSQNNLPGKTGLLKNKVIKEVAGKMCVSEAQVLIAWGIQRGCAVVPKSKDEERIKRNGTLVSLDDRDRLLLDRIAAVEGETRFVEPRELFGFDAWDMED